MNDARRKIEIAHAAKIVLRKLSNEGAAQPTGRPKTKVVANAGRLAGVKGNVGFSTIKPMKNRRGQQNTGRAGAVFSRLGYEHVKSPKNQNATAGFENFRIVADVTDNDNSVVVQSSMPARGRFHRAAIEKLPISRTIRNNLATEFLTTGRKQHIKREVPNFQSNQPKRNRNSGQGRFVNAPVFRNALQEVERSREESNEIVNINHRPVLERLSSATTSKPSNSSGFIVRVTNLSETVTDEDVEELFSSIGPLVSSKLIRSGIGQAIFVRLHDAKRAVNEFNNRELDGVAMKCNLVNESRREESFMLRSSQSRIRALTKETPKNKIEIDRDLFNEAMFRKNDPSKTNATNSAAAVVQFTVKI